MLVCQFSLLLYRLLFSVACLAILPCNRIIRRMTEAASLEGKSKHAVLVEMISALETVKTTQGNSMLRERWLNSVQHQGQSSSKTKAVSQLASYFAQLGQQMSQIGIVVYGVFLIADGGLTMGQLIACVILSGRTMAPLGQITGLLGRMNQAISAYRGLDEVLNVTTDEQRRQDMVVRPVLKGDIELKTVTFAYEDQPDPSLDNVSLKIEPGDNVAILGRIGCGKTTLLRLICGLYPPDKGLVLRISGNYAWQMCALMLVWLCKTLCCFLVPSARIC